MKSLRRAIRRSPERLPGSRRRPPLKVEVDRTAEIQQLEPLGPVIFGVQEAIARLDVAVDDTPRMSVLEGVTDLQGQILGARPWEPVLAPHHPCEILADQEGHHQEVLLVLVTCVEDLDDISVLERCQAPRLVLKALNGKAIPGILLPEDLDGESLAGLDMGGSMDACRPTLADDLVERVTIGEEARRFGERGRHVSSTVRSPA
jgi:hypothetical protein